MDWKVEEHQTSDGITIALHRIGTGQPILLIPGTFSNHTFWLGTRGVGFARYLAEHDYEAIALDPRGHGDSQRPTKGERWDFDHWIRHDVPTAIRSILDEGREPFIIGHSAGGASTLACLGSHAELARHIKGMIIVSTPVPWLQPWRGAGAWLIRATAQMLGRFPAKLLNLGPEDELEGVMTQWMSWNLQGRWTANDGSDYEVGIRRIGLPTLMISGAGDRFFAPPQAVSGLFDWIGSNQKELLICGRGTGFSEDFDHVSILVGKAARAEVWPRLLSWVERRSKSGDL